ncbi:hypothetical protein [Kutzneria chonburiensis]|uniref:DUF4352 domain-containing protein n=1 Tax=Kutzneria chonburiensis TaxID=1483604 RepID=A0ABV6MQR8_9PSEU|nr:hypothetical protein [Kutzneria chonburiensis]
MRPIFVLVAAATTLGLLAACSTPVAAPASTTSTTTTSTVATSTTTQAPADGSATHPFAFGHTWGGPGTLAVTVGVPAGYTPSGAFAPGSFPRAVVLDIEVANPADSPPLPAAAIIFQATAGNTTAEQMKDPTNGVGRPEASIEPGKSLKWKAAFIVPATPVDLTVQVKLVYSSVPAYFAGKI